MMYFLIIVVICLLVYLIADMEKLKKEDCKKGKKEDSIKELLPKLKGRSCEITINKPLASIDILYQIKGSILDSDDEWVLLSYSKRKKTVRKMFRITLITDIKELSDNIQ